MLTKAQVAEIQRLLSAIVGAEAVERAAHTATVEAKDELESYIHELRESLDLKPSKV